MYYYNKLSGLRFLEESLNGLGHTSVLPYRVYRSPEEFKPSHFPKNTPRLLIRSNLDGHASGDWGLLPREDFANKKGLAGALEVLKRLSGRTFLPEDASRFHFIVHPVLDRKDYLLSGKITFDPALKKLKLLLSPTSEVWSTSSKHSLNVGINPLELPIGVLTVRSLQKCGLSKPDAQEVLRRVKSVSILLRRKAAERMKEDGQDSRKHPWSASFTIAQQTPRHLEFYDFLVKGLGRGEEDYD